MTKAALYLRISRDRTGEGLGVERQEEDCRELADRLGWTVIETYVDNDVSAMSAKPRKQYVRMLEDLAAGKADAIIAWHPDRLYRKVSDLADLVDICKRHDVQVSTVRSGHVDLATASGRLVAGLLAQVAMYEGEHKAERWIRAWRQGREKGIPVQSGNRMFGYTRDGKILPDEADMAREVARDLIRGHSLHSLARRLNNEGFSTTRGKEWRASTLRQYLNNPRIAAHSTLKGDIIAPGQWQPILDEETWQTVKALCANRSTPAPIRVALLGGLIFCGRCGHRLITGNQRQRRTYRCPNRPGMAGCGRTSSFAAPVEEVVESFAKARLSDPRVTQRIAGLRSSVNVGELLAEVEALEGRIVELEKQLGSPGVPVEAIVRAMSRAKETIAGHHEVIAQAAGSRPASDVMAGAEWPDDLARRRQLVAIALGEERVYLDPVGDVTNRFDPTRIRIALPD